MSMRRGRKKMAVPAGASCRCQNQFGMDERGEDRLNSRCKGKIMKTNICLLGSFALVTLAIAAPYTWILTSGKVI